MLCPESLVASVTALAIAISDGRTADELDLLAAVFTQLGDTLATISVAKTKQESKPKNITHC